MRTVARIAAWLAVVALLLLGSRAFWHSRWMELPRTGWELSRSARPSALSVPVEGVQARRIADTFGAPRGSDRTHAGVDIFAARGTTVRSTTRGIVLSVRERGLGGRQVWVLGPGGERHYYAHLQDWAPQLERNRIVHPGDPLGTVGDSGNAKGTPPHLHYGIYGRTGAYDPLPLLRASKPGAGSR